jgi:cytochrome c oxidase subunit 1
MGLMHVDPQVYRMIWWGLGHSSQQINVAAMVSVWYMLGALTVGAVVLNEKISRSAFVLYVLFISMASAHHLLVDPGMGPAWKVVNTSYFMYMAVLASMIHGFTVPAGMELGQRLRGFTNGLFEWLRKAPWGDPGFSSLVFSVVVFGFVGGITGVAIGTEQINIIVHNTLRVPGHFHATVVSGTAMAFMGVTYYVIPLIFRKKVAFWPLAKAQPYVFALGMLIMTMSMTFAGSFGVPRRHWDISFTNAPFDVPFSPAVDVLLALVALGGLMAATGAFMFIAIAVKSVFLGEPLGEVVRGQAMAGVPQGLTHPPTHAANVDELNAALHHPSRGIFGVAPGTLALVGVFLLAFVLYYFVNWKVLSFVWKIG